MALPLPPPVFTILSGLVEDRSGLHYSSEDRELLAEKVSPRAIDAGFTSLLDYYYFLRYDPAGEVELDALVETLCVHESYFFREAEQLRVAVSECLVPAVEQGRRPRVWCAAAAGGEEPLTLAMMLADQDLLGRVDVLASDISERALARARSGSYGPRALRALPGGVLGRWLHPSSNGVSADSALIRAIDWRRVNLVDSAVVRALGSFDLVLCRNVLIYFSEGTTRRLAGTLADVLAPEGWLLVGVSESLMRFGTALTCEERGGVFLYRRAR
ncbi:MAG TPA: CheR family methyltransferase [Anaeromyxobacteraceae bacterium]|nr:CheR family methyltransferase [Anaeromyxobacteraceae bacterium]